jgi:S1-C subfamily serine protease
MTRLQGAAGAEQRGWSPSGVPLGAALALALLLASVAPARARSAWEETIERVSRGVVALRVTGTRAFDTEPAGVAVATGFVVDAERGLILTNRHVVRPGPVTAEAVFLNHERVRVWPVYRDPVHDYGFFRYDPGSVRFMRPVALTLAPEAARVGAEIRVIGNDAGEKLSILAGTLARLDREAPSYGRGNYGDFNTFYYQAASGISGGSSGSPVVDRAGRVIALVAGGSRAAASSFFLPLERVAYALERLRAGRPVARGTLQAVFGLEAYDELARLGLSRATEARVRAAHPGAHGLLVAKEVLPGGPAHGRLEPGDVLLALGGHPVLDFARLEAVLDAAVAGEVRAAVEREGKPLELTLPVQDLEAVTPAAYLELSGAVLHDLSLQLARSYGVPVGGVLLAGRGYAFAQAGIPARAVIRELGDATTPDLDAFERALARHPHGARVRVRWLDLARPELPQTSLLRIDRRWFEARRCERDDAGGRFPCRALPEPPPAPPASPATVRLPEGGPGPSSRLARSLVAVRFDVPLGIDGVHGAAFTGAGLVVDAGRGLVVVDRDTVPITLGDVEIVFGGSLPVEGRVVALHPEHNLALVAYDPAALAETRIESAELREDALAPGDEVWLVTLTARHQLLARESTVERVDAPSIPLPRVPRFRESNLDVVVLTETLPGVGGVLADGKGRVHALWASFSTEGERGPTSFFAGIPADALRAWLGEGGADPPPAGTGPTSTPRPPAWRTLGVELAALPLADARERGLAPALAAELEAREPSERRALAVQRVLPASPAAEALRVGDLIVRVNGRAVTRFREVERAAQAEQVALTVVRGGESFDARVATLPSDGDGTREALLWGGALLQTPPPELASQWGVPPVGVYVAGSFRGTPAERDRLRPTLRILAAGGRPTPDLTAFREAVAGVGDGEAVRLRVADLEGKIEVLSLELDLHDWPSVLLRREEAGWRRVEPALAAARPG